MSDGQTREQQSESRRQRAIEGATARATEGNFGESKPGNREQSRNDQRANRQAQRAGEASTADGKTAQDQHGDAGSDLHQREKDNRTKLERAADLLAGVERAAVEEHQRDTRQASDEQPQGDRAPVDERGAADEPGAPDDEQGGGATDAGSGELAAAGEDAPLTLADLQDPLGLNIEELYGVSLDMGPVDPDNAEAGRKLMTIGEIKDNLREAEQYRQRQDAFDEERATFAVERDSTLNQLSQLVAQLQAASGGRINTETLAEIGRIDQAAAQREESRLMQLLPAWRDGNVRVREMENISRFYKDRYGMSAALLRSVRDAGAIKAMRDFAIGALKAQEQSKSRGKPTATPKTRQGRPTPRGALRNLGPAASRSRGQNASADKVSRVSKLLR